MRELRNVLHSFVNEAGETCVPHCRMAAHAMIRAQQGAIGQVTSFAQLKEALA
jgi:hypothetical protein